MSPPQWVFKAVLVGVSLGVWFWTQAVIGRRALPEGSIKDRLLDVTAPINRFLLGHRVWADRTLILSSGLIDLLGIFLIVLTIFGPSVRPLLGLLIIFALRQICQGLCALPRPDGMIWRHPGIPSLLVIYGAASDLFFSGHTAIAVYGSMELGHLGGPAAALVGAVIVVVEVTAVLILRAHYTMDVFAGAVTALWVWTVAPALAPRLDLLIGNVFR